MVQRLTADDHCSTGAAQSLALKQSTQPLRLSAQELLSLEPLEAGDLKPQPHAPLGGVGGGGQLARTLYEACKTAPGLQVGALCLGSVCPLRGGEGLAH